MTEQKILTLDDVAELSPMSIRTTQRTKTFYFLPAEGWQRGVSEEYLQREQLVEEAINAKIECFQHIDLVLSGSRRFEFYFVATTVENHRTSALDLTNELRVCLGIMMEVTKEHNLTLLTVGV